MAVLKRVRKGTRAGMPLIIKGVCGWAMVPAPENGLVVKLSQIESASGGLFITDKDLALVGFVRGKGKKKCG